MITQGQKTPKFLAEKKGKLKWECKHGRASANRRTAAMTRQKLSMRLSPKKKRDDESPRIERPFWTSRRVSSQLQLL